MSYWNIVSMRQASIGSSLVTGFSLSHRLWERVYVCGHGCLWWHADEVGRCRAGHRAHGQQPRCFVFRCQ